VEDTGNQPATPVAPPDLRDGAPVEPRVTPQRVAGDLLDTFLDSVPLPMALVDERLSVLRANEELAEALGWAVEELRGRSIGEAMPGLAAVVAPAVESAMATREPVTRIDVTDQSAIGEVRNWQLSTFPVALPDGSLPAAGVFLVDVTRDHIAARELVDRARRLAAVASLGQRALSGRPLASLLDDAVRLVATTLGVEVVQAFECLVDGDVLLLRAASGVPEDSVGVTTVDVGRSSQAGYTAMTRAPVVSADLPADGRFVLTSHGKGLGIRSGVTVVISGAERAVWGVLGAHCVAHRDFTADDVHFLELVANVLGVAIQRKQAEESLRESHARVDLSLRAGGMVSWEWDLSDNTLKWEGSLPGILDEGGGSMNTIESFLEWIHPDDRHEVAENLAAVGPGQDEYQSLFRMNAPGEPRWLEVRGKIVHDDDAAPGRMLGVVTDVTERQLIDEIKSSLLEGEHQARVESERARERLSLLAEAGAALASSLEPRSTLLVLRDLLLPRLCDALEIYAVEDGELDEIALDHVDPAITPLLAEVRRRRVEAGGEGLWSARRAVRTGRSELIEDIPPEVLDERAVDPEVRELLRRIDPRSAMAMPLVARGRVVGAMTMLRCGDRPPFTPDDLALVEDLAARTGLAVDNARLFESRSAVARTLQRSLLPPALPEIPGVDVATRYRVAGGEIEIGGDFYDLFEVGGGAWAVVIGDVCGKGTVAAALTGLVRHTVRAAAVREELPSRILHLTNQVILDQIEDSRFCTAAMLRLELEPQGLAITASCGGHPLPLVLRADGTVEKVRASGTLLGVVPDPVLRDVDVHLAPGESIVLYTDGVTEARRDGQLFGEARLIDVLTGHPELDAFAIADLVEGAVEEFQGAGGNDDTAVLVLRALPA
jgi:PAS domain S-box-containing protein